MSHWIKIEKTDDRPLLINLDAVESVEGVDPHGASSRVTFVSGEKFEVAKSLDDFQYVMKLKTH